jgi:hypothetical protein
MLSPRPEGRLDPRTMLDALRDLLGAEVGGGSEDPFAEFATTSQVGEPARVVWNLGGAADVASLRDVVLPALRDLDGDRADRPLVYVVSEPLRPTGTRIASVSVHATVVRSDLAAPRPTLVVYLHVEHAIAWERVLVPARCAATC